MSFAFRIRSSSACARFPRALLSGHVRASRSSYSRTDRRVRTKPSTRIVKVPRRHPPEPPLRETLGREPAPELCFPEYILPSAPILFSPISFLSPPKDERKDGRFYRRAGRPTYVRAASLRPAWRSGVRPASGLPVESGRMDCLLLPCGSTTNVLAS